MNGERRLFRREKKRARGIERRGGKRRGSSLPPSPFPCVPSFLARSQERRRRRTTKTTTTTTTREDAGRRAERWRKRETTKILGLFRNSISVRRPSDAPTRSSPRHAHASVHEHATSRASLPSPSPFFPIRIRWTMLLKDEFSHECTSISRFPPARCTPFRNGRDCIEKCRGAWCNWERKKLRYLLKFRVRPGRVYHE